MKEMITSKNSKMLARDFKRAQVEFKEAGFDRNTFERAHFVSQQCGRTAGGINVEMLRILATLKNIRKRN